MQQPAKERVFSRSLCLIIQRHPVRAEARLWHRGRPAAPGLHNTNRRMSQGSTPAPSTPEQPSAKFHAMSAPLAVPLWNGTPTHVARVRDESRIVAPISDLCVVSRQVTTPQTLEAPLGIGLTADIDTCLARSTQTAGALTGTHPRETCCC